MSKNSVKPEAAKPYSEQTSLGGPIPVVMGTGPMACRLKLSGKILEHSGLMPNAQIELIAVGDGQILIRKIGEPLPGLPNPQRKNRLMDDLMQFTREKEAELREARERMYALSEDEDEGEDEAAPLNLEQVDQEEL